MSELTDRMIDAGYIDRENEQLDGYPSWPICKFKISDPNALFSDVQ